VADLLWSRRAVASLAAQDEWLRPKNPAAADSILREIERSAGLLAEFPDIGRRIDGTSLRCHVTRRYRFRIVYRIERGTVQVMDVMHPRRREVEESS
jgi:plasmid stabilization system protein ParE